MSKSKSSSKSKKNQPSAPERVQGKPKKSAAAQSKAKSKAISKDKGAAAPKLKPVADNRKAKHNYEILDSVECGLMLMGSEVKSMREGKLSLDEAYIRVKDGALWLINADIGHYANAGMWNHDPRRPRKLLVHAREFDTFAGKAKQSGLTLIPLKVYFNERGIAKCVMGLAKGKKLHDKRESIKRREAERGLSRAMRNQRR